MTTTHAFHREEVMAYLDGELTASRAEAVRAHLDSCVECRGLLAELRRVSAELSAWHVEPAPASLAAMFERTAAARPLQPAKPRPSGWFRRRGLFGMPRWALVGAPAVAVLFLVVVWPQHANLRTGFAREAAREMELPTPRVAGRSVPVEDDTQQRLMGRGGAAGGRPQTGTVVARQVEGEGQASGPMIIRTATLRLSTDRFDAMRAALEKLVAAHEGRIGSLRTSGEEPARRSLHATLRIPSAKLDAALVDLRRLGRVVDESLGSEEVTDSYRDLRIRIANSKREEQRLVELLGRRTGDLADVLQVEQALARVRGEVERMEAEERAMKSRVDLATVTVQIDENYRAIALGPLPIGARLRNALVDGIRDAAEGVIDAVLTLLAVAPTLLIWALVLAWPARWIWRRART